MKSLHPFPNVRLPKRKLCGWLLAGLWLCSGPGVMPAVAAPTVTQKDPLAPPAWYIYQVIAAGLYDEGEAALDASDWPKAVAALTKASQYDNMAIKAGAGAGSILFAHTIGVALASAESQHQPPDADPAKPPKTKGVGLPDPSGYKTNIKHSGTIAPHRTTN